METNLETVDADMGVPDTTQAPLSYGQTRITVDSLEPDILMAIIGILVRAKTRIQIETY